MDLLPLLPLQLGPRTVFLFAIDMSLPIRLRLLLAATVYYLIKELTILFNYRNTKLCGVESTLSAPPTASSDAKVVLDMTPCRISVEMQTATAAAATTTNTTTTTYRI